MPRDKSSTSKHRDSQGFPLARKITTPTKVNKTWTPGEDLALLREVLEAGEKAVNWHAALNRVNAQGAAGQTSSSLSFSNSGDRSMASVRGHWSQALRPRLELTLDHSAQDVKYGSPRRKSSKGDCD